MESLSPKEIFLLAVFIDDFKFDVGYEMNSVEFFIDKDKVQEADLEARLLALFSNQEDKALILRAEEGVPIEKAVNVLDIANRNQIKVVLAVRPK